MTDFLSSLSSSTDPDEFSARLRTLGKAKLNKLNLQLVPQNLRRFVDQERCRRKQSGVKVLQNGDASAEPIPLDAEQPIKPSSDKENIPCLENNTSDAPGEPGIPVPAESDESPKPKSKNRRKKKKKVNTVQQKNDTEDGPVVHTIIHLSDEIPEPPESKSKNKKKNDEDDAQGQPTSPSIIPGRTRYTPMAIPAYAIYPTLHPRITAAFPSETLNFHITDSDAGCTRQFRPTNINGSFTCINKRCKKTPWESYVIPITVRTYDDTNSYNVRVYNQRCNMCNTIARVTFNENAYVEKVVRRLMIWKGYYVPEIEYQGTEKTKGPHDTERCEGCRVDDCPWVE